MDFFDNCEICSSNKLSNIKNSLILFEDGKGKGGGGEEREEEGQVGLHQSVLNNNNNNNNIQENNEEFIEINSIRFLIYSDNDNFGITQNIAFKETCNDLSKVGKKIRVALLDGFDGKLTPTTLPEGIK
ncbi:hypothetical protein ACTFIR_002101 [Dictyostelium discoideum]